MNLLVSIIILVFNRFEYADRATFSVLNQTYINWELFIIDDNSDYEYKLPLECESLSQKIVLLRNDYNKGPGLSRQSGLDISNGTFVCFLDSDDYYHDLFLEKMIKFIERDTSHYFSTDGVHLDRLEALRFTQFLAKHLRK